MQPVWEHLGSVFAEQTDNIHQELKQPEADFQARIFFKYASLFRFFPPNPSILIKKICKGRITRH